MDCFVSGSLGLAVVFIGLVAVALKDAFVVGAKPLARVPMFATGLPVEDDITGEAAVDPEVAVGAAAGNGFVEIADEGFVRSNIAAFEHALFHERNEQAALVGDFRGNVAHGVGAEVDSVTLFVEHVLAVEGKMIEVFVGEDFSNQSRTPEAAFDEGGFGGLDDGRAERIFHWHEFHPQDAAQIEVGGFFFKLGLFLIATVPPGLGIGLDEFRNDFFGPDGKVLRKAIFADAAGTLFTLWVCAGVAWDLILRCCRVAGGLGLFQRVSGEEVGVIELLALASEELSLEPIKLLGEDRDLILQLLVLLLKFLVGQRARRYR